MKQGSHIKEKAFDLSKIPFKEIPNQSKLFLDFQSCERELNKLYPQKNKDIEQHIDEALARYSIHRNSLCDILYQENVSYNVGEKTLKNIEKLRAKNCVAVLTGQQAGLFSGPAYTIYKALSAVKLARQLSEKGIKAVPIFWVAAEDHDFNEIKKTIILDKNANLLKIENEPLSIAKNLPIGLIKIDNSINSTFHDFFQNIPNTDFSSKIKKRLTNAYLIKKTFSEAFTNFLAGLFNDFGLIFVSPLNKKLRKLSSPIFKQAIKDSELIVSELLRKDAELSEKNYHSQVLVGNDFFPFFFIDDRCGRNALRFVKNVSNKSASKIKSKRGTFEFSRDELIEIAENSPWRLSPSALMRPIVQDYLFPVVCYLGGGGEIAYFIQNSVIYEVLNRPVTPIRHRASFTIVESKHRKTLERYGLNFSDLLAGKEDVLSRVFESRMNMPTSVAFAETEDVLNKQLNKLDEYLLHDEPTLSESLSRRRRKIMWHIDSLRKKFRNAVVAKDLVAKKRMESLFSAAFPFEKLQERNLNAIYFLNIYGENFLQWVYDAIDLNEKDHQIITF